MSKKSNPDKGLRTINIEFGGKTRTLKFSHSAIGDFEAEANAVLRSQRIIEPGNMIFADGLMASWLGNARVFSLALKCCLANDPPENVDVAIDSYIESGGSKLGLTRDILRAYRLATDPSSLVSLEKNWKLSDERQSILTEAENQQITAIEKAIAEMKVKLTPGLPSSDLPGSS